MVTCEYRYRGARAMIILHEKYLREFIDVWKSARDKGLKLPETDDGDYASMQALAGHVLRAARGYMKWICEKLQLPDPGIDPTPEPEKLDEVLEVYTSHLLSKWEHPLAEIEEERFYRPEYESRWKVNYCIDAMLEHAVMHPVRHSFQLKELMANQNLV